MVHRQSLWQIRPIDEAQVTALCRQLPIHPLIARVLVSRGLVDPELVRRHLDPRLADLISPATMAGLDFAADRVARAVLSQEPVAIFGDYDVDGVSSVALLGDFLERCGATVQLRVARRQEGYGFKPSQAQEILESGCRLLVLVDCGTSDHEAVAAIQSKGIDVVALDHHQLTRETWPGLVLVNPQRPDCGYPYKGLASVGLAFHLVACLRRRLAGKQPGVPDPRDSLDLVALGTIADVAPLDSVNRILAAHGLKQLQRTSRPGLRELLRLCNLEGKPLSSSEVGWKLGPRLNAPGRLGDAVVSLCCLRQNSADSVSSARQCHQLNEQRQELQRSILAEALAQGEAQAAAGRAFILAAAERWHPGIIGIVASKLVERFGRPAGVVAIEDGGGRGSARGIDGLNLVQLLAGCEGLLVRYGGHRAAAGFRVQPAKLEALRQRLHELTEPLLVTASERMIESDGLIQLQQLSLEGCQELARLGPYGLQNPEPLFVASQLQVAESRLVGRNHLALVLRQGKLSLPAIGFGLGDLQPSLPGLLDAAFVPEIDDFRGPRLRLRLKALRPAADAPSMPSLDSCREETDQ